MKISLTDSYKNKGRFLGWGSGPDADWKIMFSFFIVALLIAMSLCAIYFGQVRGGENIDDNGANSPVDEARLKRVSGFYQKQKIDFESARSIPETIPDPSI